MASRNHDFMPVAVEIRKVLHYHGIHSSTIQPEYQSRNSNMIPEDHLKVRSFIDFYPGENQPTLSRRCPTIRPA